MKNVFLFLILILFSLQAFSQGEIEEQNKLYLQHERTFNLQINTNGFGCDYRYGEMLSASAKKLYEIGFSVLKNPKEIRTTISDGFSSGSFIYGKLNSVFTFRAGMGMLKELAYKKDKGAVSINYFYTYGFSLACIKPIYYDIAEYDSLQNEIISEKKFEYPKTQADQITGTASFFKGISEMSFSPGGFVKFGYSFEHSRNTMLIRSLEVGFMFEAYALKVPILAGSKAQYFFPSLFVSYRFGRIIGDY